jgi:hypothetical protein
MVRPRNATLISPRRNRIAYHEATWTIAHPDGLRQLADLSQASERRIATMAGFESPKHIEAIETGDDFNGFYHKTYGHYWLIGL